MLFSISRGINPEALTQIGPNQLFMVMKYTMITSCYYIGYQSNVHSHC